FPLAVEDLHAVVRAIRDQNSPAGVNRDAMWCVEFTRLITGLAPVQEIFPLSGEFGDAMVSITIRDRHRSRRSARPPCRSGDCSVRHQDRGHLSRPWLEATRLCC